MTNPNEGEHPIVVGVDGSASALDAVRWAAHEAVARSAPLRLVHVCHLAPVRHPKQIPPPLEYRVAMLDQGRHWLAQAEEVARRAEPALAVTTDQHDGITAGVLIEESRGACLLVLGSRGLGGFTAMLVGSIAIALSSHGHCPVVVVRTGSSAGNGPVLVGVDGSDLSDAAVTFAFETAAARGVPLIAVHAWRDLAMTGAWALPPGTIDWDWLQAQEEKALSERIAPWRAKFPNVVVREVVERDQAEHALLRHGAGAALMVVGSRGRGAIAGLGLGSVSHGLIHHAESPVAVVRTART